MKVLNRLAGSAVWLYAVVFAALFLMLMITGTARSQTSTEESRESVVEPRSTSDTISFRALAEESLSETAIEGGLAGPAEGVPVQPAGPDNFYLNPLALEPGDSRTDLGRSEIPVEFRFSNPKSVPGQTHSNNYVIRPPENRTYETHNVKMTEH